MFIEIGSHIINLDAVSSVHWEGEILVAHLNGGRWLKLDALDGNHLWEALAARAAQAAEPPQGGDSGAGFIPIQTACGAAGSRAGRPDRSPPATTTVGINQ